MPGLAMLMVAGTYAADSRLVRLLAEGFGVFGCFLEKYGFQLAPLVLRFVLAPTCEMNLRRVLIYAEGDLTSSVTRPIWATMLVVAVPT